MGHLPTAQVMAQATAQPRMADTAALLQLLPVATTALRRPPCSAAAVPCCPLFLRRLSWANLQAWNISAAPSPPLPGNFCITRAHQVHSRPHSAPAFAVSSLNHKRPSAKIELHYALMAAPHQTVFCKFWQRLLLQCLAVPAPQEPIRCKPGCLLRCIPGCSLC